MGPFDAVVDCGTFHQLGVSGARAYVNNLSAWTRPLARVVLLVRYGKPVFDSICREGALRNVEATLGASFETVSVADIDMGETGDGVRPGLEIRLRRRSEEAN
jgi:hypothetical protein